MVVVPRGLLEARRRPALPNGQAPRNFAEDAEARRRIELAAMDAVMAAERALGNVPTDVSAQQVGHDIASLAPPAHNPRFLEVKGRADGADSLLVTRPEGITT